MERQVFAGMIGRVLRAMVRTYQLLVSPLLPPSCRFLPSCSEYAAEAIERHGALRGMGLALTGVFAVTLFNLLKAGGLDLRLFLILLAAFGLGVTRRVPFAVIIGVAALIGILINPR